MTRIVGGTWSGRVLRTPAGSATRPTSERVRAALANALEATGGLDGARVLDLFAGSGALGLELVSRGAASVVLVESNREALTVLRANVAALDPTRATVVASGVTEFAAAGGADRFDIVIADPPYDLADDVTERALAALLVGDRLAPGADVVVERSVRAGTFGWPEPLEAIRTKRYGDTVLDWGRLP